MQYKFRYIKRKRSKLERQYKVYYKIPANLRKTIHPKTVKETFEQSLGKMLYGFLIVIIFIAVIFFLNYVSHDYHIFYY